MSTKLGVVGSEAAKFTAQSEQIARRAIRDAIYHSGATTVISGACHLGGIDAWAIEEAKKVGLETIEFPSETKRWSGAGGYQERNQRIAEQSDLVVCITVNVLPEDYTGMRFNLCYHCGTNEHVKSGGCWTTKYARKLGKRGFTIVVTND